MMNEKLKEKLEACFDRLQDLDIRPTMKNLEILTQTLYDLRDIYIELGGDQSGGDAAVPEGSDSH